MPNKEGHTATLMQRSHKRKRGSPEPAPRPAGSTASFSWRTLRPPRGTPRARGRGRSAPPRPTIPKAKPRPAQIETREEEDDEEVEVEESGEVEEEEGGAGPQTAPPDALPDDEEIERREEHYQRLRRTIGVGTEDEESGNAPLGFNPATLDEVQTLWDPLTAGELLARVGHFLRVVSQMMEEIGYMAEVLSRGHRPGPDPEHDATNLMQGMKRKGGWKLEGEMKKILWKCRPVLHRQHGPRQGAPQDTTQYRGRRTSRRRIGPS